MKFLIAILALVSISTAKAQDQIVSINAFDLSYTGGLLIKSDSGKGPDRDINAFQLNLNYAQSWEQYVGLMWKVQAFINREEVEYGAIDTLETRWGGAGGFLYNFQADTVKDSFFASAMLGIERATVEVGTQDDESGFNLFTDLSFGKRFDLGTYSVANISYAPSAVLTVKRYGGDIRDNYFRSGHEIKFNFLSFDILF